MLIRHCDRGDRAESLDFVRTHQFGQLVAAGRGRAVPVVTPTQFVLRGEVVLLHLAQDNPLFSAVAENPAVLLSVVGDWAYVPAAWKAIGDEDPALGIPTTYYAAVQLHCTAEALDMPEAKLDVLRRQLRQLDPVAADPSVHVRRLTAVRCLRLTIVDVVGKFKYGGNVDEIHRLAVARHLVERGGRNDAAALGHLRRRSCFPGELS